MVPPHCGAVFAHKRLGAILGEGQIKALLLIDYLASDS